MEGRGPISGKASAELSTRPLPTSMLLTEDAQAGQLSSRSPDQVEHDGLAFLHVAAITSDQVAEHGQRLGLVPWPYLR